MNLKIYLTLLVLVVLHTFCLAQEPFVFNYFTCQSDNCITLEPHIGDINEDDVECFAWESDENIDESQQRSQEVCPTEDAEYSLFLIDDGGDVIGEIFYKVHVISGELPAFSPNSNPNTELNKLIDEYSCSLSASLNDFLQEDGAKYSSLHQETSVGMVCVANESQFPPDLFKRFLEELTLYYLNVDSEAGIKRLFEFMKTAGMNVLAMGCKNFLSFLSDEGEIPPGDEGSFIWHPLDDCKTEEDAETLGWIPFTTELYENLTQPRRDEFYENYPSQEAQNRLDYFWSCAVLGRAHEYFVLESLELPHGNTRPRSLNRNPDAFGHTTVHDIDDIDIYYQPWIIEVKGRYWDNIFRYGPPSRPASNGQFRDYLNYLKSNTVKSEQTVTNGLYLILNGGVTLDAAVLEKCSEKNIPLFFSTLSLNVVDDNIVTRVEHPKLMNMPSLNYGLMTAFFLPRPFMKYAMEFTLRCKFDFKSVDVNFDSYIDRFESSYLQRTLLPPDAEETCDDCVGDHEDQE